MKNKDKKNKDTKEKYYNIKAHVVVLVIWLLIFAVISIVIGSFVAWGVKWAYNNLGLWHANLSEVLPDFLGGMLGLVCGFFLEWIVVDKIKLLCKYSAILTILETELSDIKKIVHKADCTQIMPLILDDVVLSCESSVVLYNLPGYLILKYKGKGDILRLLQQIYANIANRNVLLEKYDSHEEPTNPEARLAYSLLIEQEIDKFTQITLNKVFDAEKMTNE